MLRHDGLRDNTTLADYLRVLRRRKWIVLMAVVLAPASAVVYSTQQRDVYRGTAKVLVSQERLASPVTSGGGFSTPEDPDRFIQTQVDLARLPAVARRVASATRINSGLLDRSRVVAHTDSNILDFDVDHPSPHIAASLATAYARQFVRYKNQLDTAALTRARGELGEQIDELRDADLRDSEIYARLVEEQQRLRTLEALQTRNAIVVRSERADDVEQVQPRPLRNGIVGLVAGLVLGIGLALLWETLDTRVRSADQIAQRLGIPLLARVPKPPRRLRRRNQLVMREQPNLPKAESFRVLRTNLEFANLERGAHTIMFTSAVGAEGKSTTVANLGVAMARSGRRVVIVDLDLRRPSLARLFSLEDRPGLTDVALGRLSLADAITSVALPASRRNGDLDGEESHNGPATLSGVLEVLTSGPVPPHAGEFVETKALAGILEELRGQSELVLIDAPPLLHVGDAIALSSKVDALVVVTRLEVLRRPLLNELHRVLEASPAAKLGFVLTGAEHEDIYGYDGYYNAGRYARAERETVG